VLAAGFFCVQGRQSTKGAASSSDLIACDADCYARVATNLGGASPQYGEFLRCGFRAVGAMLLVPEDESANDALIRRKKSARDEGKTRFHVTTAHEERRRPSAIGCG